MQLDIFSTATKEEAMELFEMKRPEFLAWCREIAERVYEQKGQVTTDDIRREVKIPEWIDGRVMGAIFHSKDWKKIGYQSTTIPTSHGRPIAVFVKSNV